MERFKFLLAAILLFGPVTICNAQAKKACACTTILLPMGRMTALYDHPKGKQISSIINDSLAGNFFTLTVSAIQGEWSMVRASSGEDDGKEGWIETKNLGVFSRNYGTTLRLYSDATKKSKVKQIVSRNYEGPWMVTNCSQQWLYVVSQGRKTKLEGWLEPDMQCANWYTTCN
jgi:hypothetical protein